MTMNGIAAGLRNTGSKFEWIMLSESDFIQVILNGSERSYAIDRSGS
mgnify:CR=1 FL=1|jgi:hypothetical protein